MAHLAKRYRIEQTFARAEAEGGFGGAPAAEDPRIETILSTVQDLARMLDPATRAATDVIDACRREIAEVYALRAELDGMKEAIANTRREIASLHRSDNQGRGMRRVAGELDAVVEATEEATTTILSACEEIETQASMLKAAGVETGNNDCVGAILERVVVLYEACNFQDLTGQRITKIVGVLKFVEERLDRVIGVWGGLEAFKDFADGGAAEQGPSGESGLLNGPKLDADEGHVDQTDIDALFT